MSEKRPNCSICLHASRAEIERLVHDKTAAGRIVMTFVQRRRRAIAQSHPERAVQTFNIGMLRNHIVDCMGMVPMMVKYVGPKEAEASGLIEPGQRIPPPPAPVAPPSPETAGDPGKRADYVRDALYARLHDLPVKDLLALHMAELKLQTTLAERAAPKPPTGKGADIEDDDPVGAAMAQAAGHQPRLRGMKGGRVSA